VSALAEGIRRLGKRSPSAVAGGDRAVGRVDEKPGCAYGLVSRRAIEDLEREFGRLEAKINGLIFGVVITLLVQVWKALA